MACDPWLEPKRIRAAFAAEPVELARVPAILTGGAVQGVVVAVPHREFLAIPLDAAAVVIDVKGTLPGGYESL
jgi:hypothetical protein